MSNNDYSLYKWAIFVKDSLEIIILTSICQ